MRQVRLGPRPAGSPASRKLAAQLKAELPNGRFQAVPGGLRNVVGFVPGRDPSRTVVVGAHYDTKDLPGFVGANDGAGGTALVVELARTVKPRELRPPSSSSSSTAKSRRRRAGRVPGDRPAGEQGRCASVQEGGGDDPARLRRRPRSLAAERRLLQSRALAEAPGGGAARGHGRGIPVWDAGGGHWTTTSRSASSACPRSISSTSTTRAGI